MMESAGVWPVKLSTHKSRHVLEIEWNDGVTALLSHQRLREACRCAACTSASRAGEPVTAPAAIALEAVNPVGPNAVQFVFSDGHDRGIFPFPYLRELSEGGARSPSRA